MQFLASLHRSVAALSIPGTARADVDVGAGGGLVACCAAQPEERREAPHSMPGPPEREPTAAQVRAEADVQAAAPGQQGGNQQQPEPSEHGREQPAAGQPAAGQPAAGQPAGYNPGVEELRRQEFRRLEGRVYADYAGAAPHSERMLQEVVRELSSSLHGNPHSEAGWAPESRGAAAAAARLLTLRMCNADPERYTCIFTAGATAALKLVGESYPWGPGSTFLHLRDSHNSVLGVRQLAAASGSVSAAVEPALAAGLRIDRDVVGGKGLSGQWVLQPASQAAADALREAWALAAAAAGDEPQHLFAFPAESNLSGVRYDLQLAAAVQQRTLAVLPRAEAKSGPPDALPAGRWRVLLDAAKACGTVPPDLAACPADFVVLSYYKIFGYPTGLGALVVRNDALGALRRRYYGGGTVEVSLAEEPFHSLRPGPAGWEDGTPAFLDFPAVVAGFGFIQRLGGFPAVAAHAAAVAASLAHQLAALRHWNGAPVCVLYGAHPSSSARPAAAEPGGTSALAVAAAAAGVPPPGCVGQGPVVAFNLLRSDGSYVGYREVEKLASLSGILLRTGCCCNPGACAAAAGLSPADMRANFEAGHVCWDDADLMRGRPTGVVRASFGYASSLADADAVAALVARYWQERDAPPPSPLPAASPGGAPQLPAGCHRVDALWVYPIKSCRGFSPPAWPVGPAGLLHDRRWVVADSGGAALRLKQHPRLAAVRARVDLAAGTLLVEAAGEPETLVVQLLPPAAGPEGGGRDVAVCGGAACAVRSAAVSGGEAAAAAWFSRVLGLPCSLLQLPPDVGKGPHALSGSSAAIDTAARGGGDGGDPAQPAVARQPGSFANAGQLLVLTSASLADLRRRCAVMEEPAVFAQRFRPNLVVGGAHAYAEDGWAGLQIGVRDSGGHAAQLALDSGGPCARCDMVCIHPLTGRRAGPEPLLTLAGYRRLRGRICLGHLMNRAGGVRRSPGGDGSPEQLPWLAVGDAVQPLQRDGLAWQAVT